MPNPIVEELHRIRAQMWEECGGDLDRLIDFLRAGEAEHRDRIISKAELDALRRRSRPGTGRFPRNSTPP